MPSFDDVLREVAKRLNGGVRSYDAVSRYGGEEFLVVLVGCPSQLAKSRAEHIRRLIDSRPFDTSAGALNVSMSMGVAGTDDLIHQGRTIAPNKPAGIVLSWRCGPLHKVRRRPIPRKPRFLPRELAPLWSELVAGLLHHLPHRRIRTGRPLFPPCFQPLAGFFQVAEHQWILVRRPPRRN